MAVAELSEAERDELLAALAPFAALNLDGMVRSLPPDDVFLWRRSSNVRAEAGISVAHILHAKVIYAKCKEASDG
jgi:hypothetical protein